MDYWNQEALDAYKEDETLPSLYERARSRILRGEPVSDEERFAYDIPKICVYGADESTLEEMDWGKDKRFEDDRPVAGENSSDGYMSVMHGLSDSAPLKGEELKYLPSAQPRVGKYKVCIEVEKGFEQWDKLKSKLRKYYGELIQDEEVEFVSTRKLELEYTPFHIGWKKFGKQAIGIAHDTLARRCDELILFSKSGGGSLRNKFEYKFKKVKTVFV